MQTLYSQSQIYIIFLMILELNFLSDLTEWNVLY